jgi:ABC-2 type transport system permease protein
MKYVTQNLVKNSMLIAIFVLGIVVASYFVSVIGYSRKK